MANFIADMTNLPFPKNDSAPIPNDQDPSKFVSSSEWNQVCQGLIDTRDRILQAANAISVKQAPFFARGDGVADDRPAIKAAIAAALAAGVPVFFPPGTYMLTREPGANYTLLISGVNDVSLFGVPGRSILKVVNNVSAGTTSCQLLQISNCTRVRIRDLTFDGNWGNAATTVAAASDGTALPVATLNVADTTGFPTAGKMKVILPSGAQVVSYTGKTQTSFTGCSGGSGVLRGDGDLGRQGYSVGYYDPGHTHVAPASDGVSLPQATINVGDTSVFSAAGTITISTLGGDQLIAYTGKTATSFTGCTGGTGTLRLGDGVWDPNGGINQIGQRDAQNRLIFLYAVGGDVVDVEISGCAFRQAFGDGVWLGGDGTNGGHSEAISGVRHIKISHCTFDMMGRNGITLSLADDVCIDNCRFRNIFTTAVDTEPVNGSVTNVLVSHIDAKLWWNPFHDPVQNVLSIQGGVTATPAEWNYARGFRVLNSYLQGDVLITDACDVTVAHNRIDCDLDAGSSAPVLIDMYCENIWIVENDIYARSGGTDTGNRGAISIIRLQLDAIAAMQPGNVYVRGNAIRARGGMDGIYVEGTGGADGFAGVATGVSSTTLTDASATWLTNQFAGHFVVMGGVVATVLGNTGTTLTLATWHADTVHGWGDSKGQPVATPAMGPYVIQPTGGTIEVRNNSIDCVASDGRTAGRYGIHVTTNDVGGVWATPTNRMRVEVQGNRIRGANPYGIRVFIADLPPISYLAIRDNVVYDDQPLPTCTNAVFFERQSGPFDPLTLIGKLLLSNNGGSGVRTGVGGLVQGYWLEQDGATQRVVGYGTPEAVVPAPVGSDYRRLDGVAGGVFYVKEPGGLPLNVTAETNRSGDIKSTGQTVALDSVTTTVDNCLVIQGLVAIPGSGTSLWDTWTNAGLAGFSQIFQDSSSSGGGGIAAAAGVKVAKGTTGAGSVRQGATSNEFGNGTFTIALAPQIANVAPSWVSAGPFMQNAGTALPITFHWPPHLKDDLGLLFVQVPEGDTVAVSDPHWIQLPNSPVDGLASGGGVRMYVFGCRAYLDGDGSTTGMPAPTVTHTGANMMGRIHLFRGSLSTSNTGWVAK